MTTPDQEARAARLERAIRRKRRADLAGPLPLAPRPADSPRRLGDMQRSLWLLHRLEPSSPAYHLVSAFRVRGALDASRLEQTLSSIVSRHRMLRSTFRAEGGEVLQVVHASSPIVLERRMVPRGAAPEVAAREARKPFDLEVGPLLRLLLVSEGEDSESLLVLVCHHILADERSLELLWRELAAGYGGRHPDPADEIQYDDYAYWIRQRSAESRALDLEFWRRQLEPLPADLALPFARPPGHSPPARGKLLRRSISARTREQVWRLAAGCGTTPFVVLAFAFRLLLERYTEGRDIAFGTPVSTRSHPATAAMIGYFLNPLVIRTSIDEQRPLAAALRAFGSRVAECRAHASLPFDVLVETMSPPRRRGGHPLFQSMFVYQEAPPPPALEGVSLEPVTLDLGESKFDLTLFATPRADSLEVAVEFRADRFGDASMRRLMAHYETILAHLEGGTEQPVSGLPMLGAEEAASLAGAAQGPPLELPSTLVPDRIRDRARRTPRAAAVVSAGEEWSYGELDRVGGGIAGELVAAGVEPGDRVGLYLDRSPLMIAGILGTHWAAAAYVPLDPSYPPARNREMLMDAEVAAVLTRASLRDRVPGGSRMPTIAIDEIGARASSAGMDLPVQRAGLPAYILYTSGSTGTPKGVVVTQGNLRASTAARLQVYDSAPPRFLLVPSVAFDSSVAGIFWTLTAGGSLIIPSEDEARDPLGLARLVAEQKVSTLLCIPALWAAMLELGGHRMRGLETVIVAGEVCPPRLVEKHFGALPGTRLFNEYGPTEATVWATVHEVRTPAGPGPVPIGRPIPGVRIDVLDPLGRHVPAGVPGEAWISGPTVSQGYWRRPDLTAERFRRRVVGAGVEEWAFRSGDRVTWTPERRLVFLGRADEQLKLRGFRIEPGEVESALLEIPEVTEVAVVARPPEQLVAFAVARGPVPSWRSELAKRLPDFMIPSRLIELDELPRLANGKIDKRQLEEMDLDHEIRPESELPALDDRERALLSLWESLLGRAGIGPTENFFQLGGHSLQVVAMTAAIERDFGIELAPAEVFQNPTVRELADRMDERTEAGTAYAHLFPIEPGGSGNPFIVCVPHFFSEMLAARFRGERPVYGLRGVSLRPEGNAGRWRTMNDLGEELVEEVRRRFPEEILVVGGYSFGATMAFEMVRLLEEQGASVQRLYLIAPMPIDFYRLGPLLVQIDGLRRPLSELSRSRALRLAARGNNPLTLRPYRRAWRRLAIEPWRRLLCLVGRGRRLAGRPLGPRILHADVRVERFRLHARYRPGVVTTPSVIFNAMEPETDAAATWRPFFAGPLTVHPIPDPHLDETAIAAAKERILHHLRDLTDS